MNAIVIDGNTIKIKHNVKSSCYSFQSSWNRALSIDEFRELCYQKLTEIYAQGD